MTKNELLTLRDQELSSFYEELMETRGGLRAQALPIPEKTNQRLSIGGRKVNENYYEPIIRVQNSAGRAISRAKEIEKRVKEEYGENQNVDIAVITRITAPSQKAVAEAGSVRIYGARKQRPLQIGHSIGHRDGAPGTIGLFVTSNDGIAALSCNHVIARINTADPGDHIYQPGPPDQPADTKNRIGNLADYRELTRNGANLFDAAYCILKDSDEEEALAEENIIPENSKSPDSGKSINSIIDPFDLDLDMRVAKIGRTSGYTNEPVENVSIGVNDVIIYFPGYGNVRFDNMIEIQWSNNRKPFAKPGDSGSILYQEGSLNAFGMHVASGIIERKIGTRRKKYMVSYACPLNVIMKTYELELL